MATKIVINCTDNKEGATEVSMKIEDTKTSKESEKLTGRVLFQEINKVLKGVEADVKVDSKEELPETN